MKKPFQNWTYDPETRTFKADFVWVEGTWEFGNKWSYEMIFSNDFKAIVGGGILYYKADDQTKTFIDFGSNRGFIYEIYYENSQKTLDLQL